MMKYSTTTGDLPWVPLALLAALLSLTPHAMGFPPRDWPSDPFAVERVLMVVFGLLATVVAGVHFAVAMFGNRRSLDSLASSAALFVSCFVIGWRLFPYWVLGVYQVATGAFPWRDQDPKSLIPMTWIGGLWSLPILLFQFAVMVIAPCLLIAIVILIWKRRFVPAFITVVGTSVAAFFFLRSGEGYMGWLLD